MKVKICGLTNREDAVWALNDGAQFLGVDFRKQGVQLNGPQTPQRLKALRRALTIAECPPFIIKALAFPGPETLDHIPRWGD